MLGGCAAIPNYAMPDFQALRIESSAADPSSELFAETGDPALIGALKLCYFSMLLLYYGVQRLDLVPRLVDLSLWCTFHHTES